MITSKEIGIKARKKYIPYLSACIQGNEFSRIIIPCDKKPSNDLASYEKELNDIKSLSKEVKGFGYSIVWQTITKKLIGTQDIPSEISFDSETDFLNFLKKEREVQIFRENSNQIIEKFPELKDWIIKFPQKVIDNADSWIDLLKVLSYFKENPIPDLYIRELPIQVHTKFIERNKGLLKELLDKVISNYIHPNESSFEKRYNLKYVEPQIRVRILDESLSQEFLSGIEDASFPVSVFQKINLRAKNVFIVENQINFLTFPKINDSIIIWGHGYGVAALKGIDFLKNANLYYWGDYDAQGFEILSQFRGYFPQTKNLLMDKETFDLYFENDPGKPSNVSVQLNLTKEEEALYQLLKANNWRLEQEKIPQEYLEEKLKTFRVCIAGL